MKGIVAQKGPFAVELEAGHRVYAAGAHRGGVRHGLPVRLQADQLRPDVRRQPRDRLTDRQA